MCRKGLFLSGILLQALQEGLPGARVRLSEALRLSKKRRRAEGNEDMNNLEWSWSSRQKEWCCVNEHKGCPRLPNCHTAPSSWSHQKRHYCCPELGFASFQVIVQFQ